MSFLCTRTHRNREYFFFQKQQRILVRNPRNSVDLISLHLTSIKLQCCGVASEQPISNITLHSSLLWDSPLGFRSLPLHAEIRALELP